MLTPAFPPFLVRVAGGLGVPLLERLSPKWAYTRLASSVLSAEPGALVVRVIVSWQVGRPQALKPVATLARATYTFCRLDWATGAVAVLLLNSLTW